MLIMKPVTATVCTRERIGECVPTCGGAWKYTCREVCGRVCLGVCVRVRVRVSARARMCVHVCMHARACLYMHACVGIDGHVRVN